MLDSHFYSLQPPYALLLQVSPKIDLLRASTINDLALPKRVKLYLISRVYGFSVEITFIIRYYKIVLRSHGRLKMCRPVMRWPVLVTALA